MTRGVTFITSEEPGSALAEYSDALLARGAEPCDIACAGLTIGAALHLEHSEGTREDFIALATAVYDACVLGKATFEEQDRLEAAREAKPS